MGRSEPGFWDRCRGVALASALGTVILSACSEKGSPPPSPALAGDLVPALQTIFIITMENKDWSSIKGNATAPFINETMLPMGAHAEQYLNPPGVHPSLPNYLWMVAGTDFGIRDDRGPELNSQATTDNLGHLMNAAGVSWKAYEEDISGTECPLQTDNPFVYFDELTDGVSPSSPTCIAHLRPLTELETDLRAGTVPRFAFIRPNLCNDMHDCPIQAGDEFLAKWVPKILASSAYHQSGALFLTWDEGLGTSDGPIGMVLLSPLAKSNGYSNQIHYDHGSLLRTVQEAFGLTPLLGDAANQTSLSDLFKQ